MFSERSQIEVRDRIIETARELFVKNGYNGTSIRDIANASGTNVAMVNYYFGSKYNLFGQIFEESFNLLVEKIFSILSSDIPFFCMIEIWVNSYYEVLIKNPHLPNFILTEVNINPGRLTSMLKEKKTYKIFNLIKERVNKEIEKGTIKKTTPENLLLSIFSLGVFPFVLTNVATAVLNIEQVKYLEMLEQHKSYVVNFVIDSIKP